LVLGVWNFTGAGGGGEKLRDKKGASGGGGPGSGRGSGRGERGETLPVTRQGQVIWRAKPPSEMGQHAAQIEGTHGEKRAVFQRDGGGGGKSGAFQEEANIGG